MNEGEDPHLCITLGALERIPLVGSLYARGPATPAELTAIVTLLLHVGRREFSAIAPSPAGVSSIVSSD